MASRESFIAEMLGIEPGDVRLATAQEIAAAIGASLTPEVLEVSLQPTGENGEPVDFWHAAGKYWLDDPTFAGGIVCFDDLDYNSQIGMHVREGAIVLGETDPVKGTPAPKMKAFDVGKPYPSAIQKGRQFSSYTYTNAGHTLILSFPSPKPSEIEAVRTASEFALYVANPQLLFFMYRFGEKGKQGIPWSDCPFSWSRVPREYRTIPAQFTGAQRTFLIVHMIDSDTGILVAARMISFSPEFTQELHATIRRQAEHGGNLTDAQQGAMMAPVYRQFPTPAAMLARAKARCVGGEEYP